MCEVFHYIKGPFPVPIPQGGNTTETALPPTPWLVPVLVSPK